MRLLAILSAFVITGCAVEESQDLTSVILQWSDSDYLEKTLILDDPIVIREFTFPKDHLSTVTIGTRKNKDGYMEVAGPLMPWGLRDGKLQIIDHDKSIFESLTLLMRRPGQITAKNIHGDIVNYRVK